jgi:putative membrane protein
MFFQLLLFVLLGVVAGIFTGLIPGIHINLVSVLVLGMGAFLLKYFNVYSLIVFIIAMSITHSFLDSIPSIFLGAPDSAQALGVLPGHRYLLKGKGLEALKLTLIGSLGSIVLSCLLFIPILPFIHSVYPLIKDYIGYILIFVVLFMLLREKRIIFGIFVFLLSGLFGLLVFNFNIQNPLFPMLSGIFGISTLIISIKDKNKIPEQKDSKEINIKFNDSAKAISSGQFSGMLTAIFPGLGSAQAAIIAMQIANKLKENGFLVLIGAINTANFTMSLATLYVLNKARNGSVVVISKMVESFGIKEIIVFLCVGLIAASLSVYIAIKIGKVFANLISKVNYKFVVMSIISLIFILSLILTGPFGVFILVIGSAIGIIPALSGISRTHAMGCLLLPVISYFIL